VGFYLPKRAKENDPFDFFLTYIITKKPSALPMAF
jgi:hypothetical protein